MYSSKISSKHNVGVSHVSQAAADLQALEMDRNGCLGCTDCDGCHDCIKCTSCKDCTACVTSTNLVSCVRCVDCSDLSSLNNEYGLSGCPSGG